MKTNRLWKALVAILLLVLFHLTLVRVAEYRRATAAAEKEATAALSAERTLGVRPPHYTLPGGWTL